MWASMHRRHEGYCASCGVPVKRTQNFRSTVHAAASFRRASLPDRRSRHTMYLVTPQPSVDRGKGQEHCNPFANPGVCIRDAGTGDGHAQWRTDRACFQQEELCHSCGVDSKSRCKQDTLPILCGRPCGSDGRGAQFQDEAANRKDWTTNFIGSLPASGALASRSRLADGHPLRDILPPEDGNSRVHSEMQVGDLIRYFCVNDWRLYGLYRSEKGR